MQNKKIIELEKEVDIVLEPVTTLTIKGKQDLQEASEILTNLNRYKDRVKEERERITKPLNEALKAARDMFRPVEARLDESISSLRGAMTVYQTEQDKVIAIATAKAMADIESGKVDINEAVTALSEIERVDAPIATSNKGSVSFKLTKKFEVMDVTMLPPQYLLANDVMIRASMKEGVELSGVRYFSEKTPINYR